MLIMRNSQNVDIFLTRGHRHLPDRSSVTSICMLPPLLTESDASGRMFQHGRMLAGLSGMPN